MPATCRVSPTIASSARSASPSASRPLECCMTERELVAAIRGVRVLVVGDAMLDRHLMGEAERLSPEAPVPVVRIMERRVTPGGAANVAANVTAAGGTCSLVGVVGADAPGAELRAAVSGARVRDLLLTVRDRPPT